MINHQLMWRFGYGELATKMKKQKVTLTANKFNNCDAFFNLVWRAFLVYALEEFALQREALSLEDSWAGFMQFLQLQTPDDELRR